MDNRLLRLVGLWGVSACAAVPANCADAPALPKGAPVVRIPFTQTPDFKQLLRVRLSINGGQPESFVVDTGSTGIVVAASSVPNFDANGTPGELTYSSSGIREIGVWQQVAITFPDAMLPDGSPVVGHVPVLAVTRVECSGQGVNAASCHPNASPTAHMLGIGFGRGTGEHYDGQLKNIFVQLDAMVAGSMRRGYTITPDGLQLGLNAESLGSGWVWQKLTGLHAKEPAGYHGPHDWQTAPGTFEVGGAIMAMGTILLDTGLTNMMLAADGQPKDIDLPAGMPVKIDMLKGQLRYDFVVGDLANPAVPRRVSWRPPTHGTFVNTGLHALSLYDYAYDADGGYVGLRPRKR